ncbi:hypothetical protein WN48_03350 [Eufriesea mexicana]|uniref:Uncharacterized protein n=1 Tax=Eufriesea mexicana TaxID=516756 RepID=A0A310SPP6_9HYME|nr:hypothetical protein WN48_03350 [Eufriesea mexicana]
MSFLNSLQQYVSDSVANFNLSPKRFSFSREDSASSAAGRSGSTGSVTGTTNTNSTAPQSTPHGYPKVVPPPGAATSSHGRSLSTRRRTLECTSAPGLTVHPAAGSASGSTSPRRVGSFRRSTGSGDRPPLMFCRRRPSWPEVDIQATSGSTPRALAPCSGIEIGRKDFSRYLSLMENAASTTEVQRRVRRSDRKRRSGVGQIALSSAGAV